MKNVLDEKIRSFEKKWLKKGDDEAPKNEGASGQRVAYELLIATIFFGGIGFLIDQQLDTTPLFLLLLFFLGFATGVYNAWRVMQGLNNEIGLKKDEDKTPPAS